MKLCCFKYDNPTILTLSQMLQLLTMLRRYHLNLKDSIFAVLCYICMYSAARHAVSVCLSICHVRELRQND